jgi:hypothetical protein
MATTIQQGFSILRQNLEITTLQSGTVSTRQTNVRANIAKELDVLDSFLAGSYQRNTMIAPLKEADVDIFIVFDPKYYSSDQNGPANLLDRVKRVLLKSYRETTDISRNGQAVTIKFSDFCVDVVPTFYRNGGGYLIPDSVLKRWIETDPTKHVEIWTQANKAHNGDLVPLIKMLKGWNKCHSEKFTSFHLGSLVLNVFSGKAVPDFPVAVRDFFQLARFSFLHVNDPAGYGGNIASYLNTPQKQQDVKDRLDRAFDLATNAVQFQLAGMIAQAFDKWRIIFGDYFPAYG